MSSSRPVTVEVKGLAKVRAGVEVLRDVTFSAHAGEVVGFLGPNGAGKTTTMRILATCLTPSAGIARINGLDVVATPLEVRRRIGYLPETPPLYDEMTVAEYLLFIAKARSLPRREIQPSINSVVERCGLGDVRRRLCGHLSSGYRRRAGIAQAIIHKPELLILDEPTNGLDPQQCAQLRELIRSLAKESTVLFSTHLLHEVQGTCSNVVIIHEGRVVKRGPLAEVTRTKSLEQVFLECVDKRRDEVVLSVGNL